MKGPIDVFSERKASSSIVGLTLIEVLIALAIVAIAFTAIIKVASQNIRATTYLQEKTVATWVGLQVVNEARVGLLVVPEAPGKLEQETTMLGHTWAWHLYRLPSANKQVREVQVDVLRSKSGTIVTSLVGYVRVEK
ncbi:MAG: type II secretion system protein GspI [Gammaproteobacteria bacterium RIFCSPHIGHO2_12_FULL_41_20]|nr:MAG: type II secretion system protein GspI [Gammaproteobacteria bacterium RIFCSPHIGHO2_12_FULL_41_20]